VPAGLLCSCPAIAAQCCSALRLGGLGTAGLLESQWCLDYGPGWRRGLRKGCMEGVSKEDTEGYNHKAQVSWPLLSHFFPLPALTGSRKWQFCPTA
jgi:hypothetical protein